MLRLPTWIGWLDGSTSGQQLGDQDDEGHDEEEVDQVITDPAEEPEQPEDEENYEKCPEHG